VEVFRLAAIFLVFCASVIASPEPAFASEKFPWAPEVRCNLNSSQPRGLHPEAYSALRNLSVQHRITQGINHSSSRGNVHDTDVTLSGVPYTGAVDISVRCLSEAQIRSLLEHLANAGFAGWYRKDKQDGWSGPPHIHAVWSGCSLKPILRWQVESWLSGHNGLRTNQPYQFWQSSVNMRDRLRALYRMFN
jgi:hypothetical protein